MAKIKNNEPPRKRGRPRKNPPRISVDLVKNRADFVRYFIEQDFNNPSLAYRRAYPDAKDSTSNVESSRLLKDPTVQEALSIELQAVLKEKRRPLEKRILDTWIVRAFYDVADLIDEDGHLAHTMPELKKAGLSVVIDGIDIKPDKDGGEHVVYKLADKDKALEMLQKYIQMIKPFDAKIGDDSYSFAVEFVKSQDKE